jgi:AcrR family transcriptional regulator
MPRPKTRSDEDVLDAANKLMHERGPEALTFENVAKVSGLSAATLVQRFESKAGLKQRTLLRAWDLLDERTERAVNSVPRTPAGAVELLVALSRDYGSIETYAEGLLILREDLRDPVLRARGAAWQAVLSSALDACFAEVRNAPPGIGLLLAAQWQGALLWWSFDPREPVEKFVEASLSGFVAAVIPRERGRRGGLKDG